LGKQLLSGIEGKAGQPEHPTQIRATKDGLFAIEVLANGKAASPELERGLAMVDLKPADQCQVRLINDAPFEVAVRLTLDGVDCFWFTKQRAGYWLVPARSSLVVEGWQLDQDTARRFEIVPFKDSVAAKTGVTGDVGVICALFHRAYLPGEKLDDEVMPSTKSLGVGAGDVFKKEVKFVDRQVGKLRASVPVRYSKPTP